MVKPPPLRPSKELTHDLQRTENEQIFYEHFGQDFAAHRVLGFVSGPSPDDKMMGIVLFRADGACACLSMTADLLPEFAACIAATWQHLADKAALEGPPAGAA
jgi:hypothetical protein